MLGDSEHHLTHNRHNPKETMPEIQQDKMDEQLILKINQSSQHVFLSAFLTLFQPLVSIEAASQYPGLVGPMYPVALVWKPIKASRPLDVSHGS